MTDADFLVLVTLFVVSDPWPLSPDEHGQTSAFLNREAQARGFVDWTEAYHELPGRLGLRKVDPHA